MKVGYIVATRKNKLKDSWFDEYHDRQLSNLEWSTILENCNKELYKNQIESIKKLIPGTYYISTHAFNYQLEVCIL